MDEHRRQDERLKAVTLREPNDAARHVPKDAGHLEPNDAARHVPKDAEHQEPNDAARHVPKDAEHQEPNDAAPDAAARPGRGAKARRPMHPYLELSKFRLTLLVVVTTVVGFLLAGEPPEPALLLWTMIGTGLAAGGANAFNQWREARFDALMERTRIRPIPAAVITRRHAFLVAAGMSVAGVGLLAWRVNLLTAALGAFVILLYVLVYTPLKRRTPLCTLVGAVCGAIPPMMGWSGATGGIGYGAWLLALVLFLWQIPHFLALAWLYRKDYERGGYRMLPSVDPMGRLTSWLAVVYIAALLPVGAVLFVAGLAGPYFLLGSFLLGLVFLALGLRLVRVRCDRQARGLFLGSIAYLPLWLGLLVADPGGARAPDPLGPAPVRMERPEPWRHEAPSRRGEPRGRSAGRPIFKPVGSSAHGSEREGVRPVRAGLSLGGLPAGRVLDLADSRVVPAGHDLASAGVRIVPVPAGPRSGHARP